MSGAQQTRQPVTGLVLAGGGARAAYQVGVLKAVADLWPRHAANPFPVVCGTSAGAINGAVLAIHADQFHLGVRRLVRIWRNFEVDQVYRTDPWGLVRTGGHWLAAMAMGGLGRFNPYALLDRSPLEVLLRRYVRCEHLQDMVDKGVLRAFGVTASGYSSGQSVTFYQGADDIVPWRRSRRVGIRSVITRDHLMASSAIPFVFAAAKINREFFGDGGMRQMAPISPAVHLGADRVLVVGVREDGVRRPPAVSESEYPSLAQVAGYVLDSIFLDSLEADLERVERVNSTLAQIPGDLTQHGMTLRHVDVLMISPSRDIEQIAARYMAELPRTLRALLRGAGAIQRRGSSLVSYILFERGYTRELVDMGYQDTMARRDDVLAFLSPTAARSVARSSGGVNRR